MSKINKGSNFSYLQIFLSICFSLVYISIPWAEIRNRDFTDYQRYVDILESLNVDDIYKVYTALDLIKAFTNEVLWWKLISFIYGITQDGEMVFTLISFFVIFTYFLFLIKRTTVLNVIIILFNPLIIDLIFSQVRSAFAFSLILISYSFIKNKFFFIGFLLVVFIHSAMALILFIFFILWFLVKSKNKYIVKDGIFSWLLGFGVAFFIVFGSTYVLGRIEDRRADYGSDVTQSSTVVYALYWLLLGAVLAFKSEIMNKELLLFRVVGIFVSSLFFFLCFFDFYGSRFLALLLPLFLIAALNVKYLNTMMIKSSYLLYMTLQFYYWL